MFKSALSQLIYNTAISPYTRPNNTVQQIGLPPFIATCLVGQSKFETYNYTNKFCHTENCFFSYCYSSLSIWQVPGGGRIADNKAPVAKYASLQDSVHEMQDWIKRRQRDGKFPADLTTVTTPHQYAALLQKCGFFQGWSKYTPEQNLNFYADGISRGISDGI